MGDVGNTYYILHVIYYTLTYNSKLGIDTVTAVEGYMPASHSGAPKCPPITSRCDCNKHDYYWHDASGISCTRGVWNTRRGAASGRRRDPSLTSTGPRALARRPPVGEEAK